MIGRMSRQIFVHIGAPKTGTTYLQDRLTLNSRSLAAHGVHFPGKAPFVSPGLFHFRAALDLLGQDWGGAPGHADGSWEAFVRRARRRDGTVILSHEILAPAKPERIERLKHDLRDSELHVVYSARDLGRQLPAAWQESIKQGRSWSYHRFLTRVRNKRTWFSRALDLPEVLGAWSAGLSPERVHVVTVPSRSTQAAHGDTLWLRFCEVFGIDPVWAPLDSDRANRSLGMAETQLIRRLNRRVQRRTRGETSYDELIRQLLAEQQLVNRDSAAVRLPPDLQPWVEQEAERWIEWLRVSGVHVVGDLEELRPARPPDGQVWSDPDRVPAKQQLGAALDALSVMTREAARRPDPDQQLTARVRTQARRLRHR